MADSRAEEWLKRASKVEADQVMIHTLYDTLSEIFYPERQDFLSQQSLGLERTQHIFNGWPSKMRYDLSNQFGAMMRQRGREWFRRTAKHKDVADIQGVREWCDESTDTLRNILYERRAQFTRAMMEQDNDYVTFGTSIGVQTYNSDRSGVLFLTRHPRDVYFELSCENEPDIVYEDVEMTGRQLGKMFRGGKGLAQELKDAIEKRPTEKLKIKRIVVPVTDYEMASGKPPKGAQYVSLYIDPRSRTVIPSSDSRDEAFFWTMPYLIRRWFTVSGEAWGRSPCTMLALGDARMGQTLRRSLIDAIEKATDPPMLAMHDGVMGDFNFHAGGVTFARRDSDYKMGRPVEPIQLGSQPNYGLELEERVTDFLQACFFQNVLKLPSADAAMTAYEVSERIEEYIRSAGPVFEPMEADNARMLERTADLAERMGAFSEMPEELEQAGSKFEFETPVSIALDKMRVQQAIDVIGKVAAQSQLDKNAPMRVNWKELQRDMMKGSGPARWWNGDQPEADDAIAADDEQMQAQNLLMMAKEAGLTDMISKGGVEQMKKQPAQIAPPGEEMSLDAFAQ